MIWPGFVDNDCVLLTYDLTWFYEDDDHALQVSSSSTYDMLGPGKPTSLLPVKSRSGPLLTHWLRAACECTPIT